MKTTTSIDIQIKSLPSQPGVYQFFDAEESILYVGKAKNLKKRVASYFNKTLESGKTRVLVKKIVHIKHIVVETETDALLLENNLIKKYKPRYNVLLKDDKSYPWICIKKERFPRIFTTRKILNDGSEYYGPYTRMQTVRTLLDLIKNLNALRSCHYDLSEKNIQKGKYKVCLEYHLKNCLGPCENKQSEADYDYKIKAIRAVLKGDFKWAIKYYETQMGIASEKLDFENAQQLKERIHTLKNYQAKSTVVSPKVSNIDVFSIVSDASFAYINFLQIVHGSIIRSHTLEIKKRLEESDSSLLELGVVELRQRFNSQSKEILSPIPILKNTQLKVVIPKVGDKKKLLDLSARNASYFRMDKLKKVKIVNPDEHANRILSQLKQDLGMSKIPYHIECFDNSNIQGNNPVAACVVFKNAKPSKKDYRHFNIKTVEGPDDFASMEEVVYRRYKRLLEEDHALPQLIVIDGGKGQLSSALKSIDRLGLRNKIAILGIAKRLEEIFLPEDPYPLYLDKKSESLKLIQQLRNEAHRFGIIHHRKKRIKSTLKTELQTINGIGEKSILTLLKSFRSLKNIENAPLNELVEIVGNVKAQLIFNHYHKKK